MTYFLDFLLASVEGANGDDCGWKFTRNRSANGETCCKSWFSKEKVALQITVDKTEQRGDDGTANYISHQPPPHHISSRKASLKFSSL